MNEEIYFINRHIFKSQIQRLSTHQLLDFFTTRFIIVQPLVYSFILPKNNNIKNTNVVNILIHFIRVFSAISKLNAH